MTERARNPRGEGARLRDEIVEAARELLDESEDVRALTSTDIGDRMVAALAHLKT